MQTVTETRRILKTQLHFRHGQDLAILGKPRRLCRNRLQRKGYQDMSQQMSTFDQAAAEGPPCPELDGWAADLQARKEQAKTRRRWAMALKAEGEALEAEAGSPFGVERIRPDLDVVEVA